MSRLSSYEPVVISYLINMMPNRLVRIEWHPCNKPVLISFPYSINNQYVITILGLIVGGEGSHVSSPPSEMRILRLCFSDSGSYGEVCGRGLEPAKGYGSKESRGTIENRTYGNTERVLR